MSAPFFPSFTTPLTLSSLKTASAVSLYFSQHPEVTCLSLFARIACLTFPLKSIAIEHELKINSITADKRSWKILPLEEECQNALYCKTQSKKTLGNTCIASELSQKYYWLLCTLRQWGPVNLPERHRSVQCKLPFLSGLSPCYTTTSPSVAVVLSYK